MEYLLIALYCLIIIATLCGLYRLFKGPSVVDRMLAFDSVTVCAIGLLVLFSLTRDTVHFQDLILIFCLLGFATTVAFVFYLHRTDDLIHDIRRSPELSRQEDLK